MMTDLTITDPAWMQNDDDYTDDDEPTLTAEVLGEALRNAIPGLVEETTEGEVYQRGDEELVVWDGYGFRIDLNDGSCFDIQIQQRYRA